jgi:hypothetical protein
MSVTSTAYSVTPAQLKKLRGDNEVFASLFGEDDGEDASWEVPKLEFIDFEDTHRLLHYAGAPTMHKILDFELMSDEFEYEGYDISLATPAQVKKIAGELAKMTLAKVREKGLAAEFKSDRRHELLKPEDYDAQFAEIARVRDFFAKAAKKGNAVIAAAI